MKSKIIGKKQLLIFTLVGSLCLAVFVNWYYTKPEELNNNEPQVTENVNLGDAQYVNSTQVESTDYFESAKLNRTKAHDSAVEHLQSIIDDASSDSDSKASAREKLTSLSEIIKLEADIENLITAQTSSECLVTINNETVEVVLPVNIIDETSIVKVKDIIISKTAISPENITIIELK